MDSKRIKTDSSALGLQYRKTTSCVDHDSIMETHEYPVCEHGHSEIPSISMSESNIGDLSTFSNPRRQSILRTQSSTPQIFYNIDQSLASIGSAYSTYKFRHSDIFTRRFFPSTVDGMSTSSELEMQSSCSYQPSTFPELNHNGNSFTYKKSIIFKYLNTICIIIFVIHYLFHLSQNFRFCFLHRCC